MIVFLVCAHTRHTHKAVAEALPFVQIRSYERVFRARRLRAATYVFTDLDRLGFFELELAADLYRQLAHGGCQVLNDPARFLGRYALIHQLFAKGVNPFRAWRADEGTLPERYPVFLRTEAAHRGTISDLLHDPGQAREALESAIGQGYAVSDLLFIEYCAEPAADGVFWKHSVYRIGGALVPASSVLDDSWQAKVGIQRLATPEQLQFESALVRGMPHEAALREVFDLASIDYGRVDFAIIDDKIVVYEINTNPYVSLRLKGVSPIRIATLAYLRDAYLDALSRLDCPSDGTRIQVKSDRFRLARGRNPFRRRLRTP